ncbi:MAG: ABC transporter permease subunit [Streptosporangiales bacterium]|nr:ABC transporter permease subunit [Streptosporangiales bacterium]
MSTIETSTVTGLDTVSYPRAARSRRWLLPAGRVAVPVVALLLWLVLAPLTELVPAPIPTVKEAWDGFATGWIYPGIQATASAVFTGFALGTAFAFPAGYLLGRSRYLNRVFEPLITGTFAIPRIIVYPILLTLFGVGFQAETGMVAISAFFPIVMSTAAAVRQASRTLLKLGRSLNASRAQIAMKIVIPEVAPGIMVGIRIGFSISFIAAIIAEFFAAKEGLGLMISRAHAGLDLPRMYAIVLLVMIAAFGGNMILWWAERRLRRS